LFNNLNIYLLSFKGEEVRGASPLYFFVPVLLSRPEPILSLTQDKLRTGEGKPPEIGVAF
jgi:hypothetical protein